MVQKAASRARKVPFRHTAFEARQEEDQPMGAADG